MAPADNRPSLRYRSDIDGLRAIAVIAVVTYHAFPKVLPGGFVGVDVFFVISGYLITRLIVSDLDGGEFSFIDFYARRIRRIFPALLVVLLATLVVGAWIFLPAELSSLAKNTIASALFSANLMLLSESGYFDINSHLKPLLHLWSLGIEEQFYLAWPLALWLIARRGRTAIIVATIVASFALNVALVNSYPEATFYLPFTRVWELIAGAALVGISVKSAKLREALSILGIIGALFFFVYNSRMTFPGWAALVPVVGTSATILSSGSFLNRIVLSHPVAVLVGRISYPLYLWHWPIFVFASAYIFRPLRASEAAGLIAASFVLAWLTYEYIERPVRSGKFGGTRTALLGMSAAAVFAVIILENPPQPSKEISRFVDVSTGSLEWRFHECMLVAGDPDFASTCVDPERPLVAVWGDSTAAALLPGLRDMQSRYRFGIAQFTVSGCPPLLIEAVSAKPSCVKRNHEALRRMTEAPPRIVLLNALWGTNSDELKPSVDALRLIGVRRIIVLGSVPVWPDGLPNAVAVYHRRTGRLIPERTTLFVRPQSSDDSMRVVADALGVEFISLRNLLCDKDGCLTRVGDDLIISDNVHFTPAGAKYMIMKIESSLLGDERTHFGFDHDLERKDGSPPSSYGERPAGSLN